MTQNSPNHFNPTTMIGSQLQEAGPVGLDGEGEGGDRGMCLRRFSSDASLVMSSVLSFEEGMLWRSPGPVAKRSGGPSS